MAEKKISVIKKKMDTLERHSRAWLLLRKQELSYLARIQQRFDMRKQNCEMHKRKDWILGTLEVLQESIDPDLFKTIIMDCQKELPVLKLEKRFLRDRVDRPDERIENV
jgi:hypothetical protein